MFERYSDRSRRVIVSALWSARRRGGSYIEPEDLLHGLIREDRGEFDAISAEVFPGDVATMEASVDSRRSFFPDSVATSLLRGLHEDTQAVRVEPPGEPVEQREPAPHRDMPVSEFLRKVMASVAKTHENDTTTIEPLDLLVGIVEQRDSPLAQLLRDHGITRQRVAKALAGESE